jgi:hypothetical protein
VTIEFSLSSVFLEVAEQDAAVDLDEGFGLKGVQFEVILHLKVVFAPGDKAGKGPGVPETGGAVLKGARRLLDIESWATALGFEHEAGDETGRGP